LWIYIYLSERRVNKRGIFKHAEPLRVEAISFVLKLQNSVLSLHT
jgi:hypothetical protein